MQAVPSFAGYQIIEKLYESASSLVYRACRRADNHSVILKLLKAAYPSSEQIAWFKREYDITRKLQLEGVVATYDLATEQHQWFMVMEDFGGESLHRLGLAGHLDLHMFLTLARNLTEILQQIHQRNIIHKDINPSNIVFHPASQRVKIIDFGIATFLAQETISFDNPLVLEGTLPYISPEQTGRMNRAIDYRTDFYSLGITLYELLTGSLPFASEDLMELVHAHLAKQPDPPHTRLPAQAESVALRAISAIILKLMAKDAEDRYQSAHGILADLKRVHASLVASTDTSSAPPPQQAEHPQTTGSNLLANFQPGTHDRSDRFHLPQKLYGREAERQHILAAFERVCQGTCEVLLISGHAGVGKSALVKEIYCPMTRERSYLVSGKFDLFQRDTPYSALIQAFRSLIRQLLTEETTRIAAWREKLLAACGANGQLLIDVIPELALIIGEQPPVPDLPTTESHNRFLWLLQRFIHVFMQPEHPLVLFMDDIQWADSASLNLLEAVLTASENQHLFLLGAYRDNEVRAGHPLNVMRESLEESGIAFHELHLEPLPLQHLTQLVADTLHHDEAYVRPLAELIDNRTAGNPFFLQEFLKSLYSQHLLTFDAASGWQWDQEKIEHIGVTENVVDLMISKMQQFTQETRHILKLAACIGNQFELALLADIAETSLATSARNLQAAVVEGLLIPQGQAYKVVGLDVGRVGNGLNAEYRFAHDRIQHAAYTLMPEEERQHIHWRIGQIRYRQLCATHALSPDAPYEHLQDGFSSEQAFAIVNQLNMGLLVTTDKDPRLHLPAHNHTSATLPTLETVATLNLLAGQRAKASAAYQPALHYLQSGITVLNAAVAPATPWQQTYPLMLELTITAAEVAFLCNDFTTMERLVETVLNQAQTLLDRERIYEVIFQAHVARNRLLEAIETGREVLQLLGITLPQQPEPTHIKQELQATRVLLEREQLANLEHLAPMTDPHKITVMRLLTALSIPAYNATPALLPLIVCNMVNISLQSGYSTESPFAYAVFALLLCGVTGDVAAGNQVGMVALRLLEKSGIRESKARTLHIVHCNVTHWTKHIRQTFQPLKDGYLSGIETGDFSFAAMSIHCYCFHRLYAGVPLATLEQEMAVYQDAIIQLHQEAPLHYHCIYHQTVLNLLGRADDLCKLQGTAYEEEQMLDFHKSGHHRTTLFVYYFNKLMLCFLSGRFHEAIQHAEHATSYLDGATGLFLVPLLNFYDSLVRLALLNSGTPGRDSRQPAGSAYLAQDYVERSAQEQAWLEHVQSNQQALQRWAQDAPMNHQHRYELVAAELARVQGRHGDAREHYDAAIALAHEHQYIQDEGLANELAAAFYLAKGQSQFANVCLREAHYAYQQWGSVVKVVTLEDRYPQLQQQLKAEAEQDSRITTSQSIRFPSSLDIVSVIKALQAISREIVLETLLANVMRSVLQNAGAQRGVLILETNGHLFIEAAGTTDTSTVQVLQSIPITEDYRRSALPMSIIQYVARTQQNVVLSDAMMQGGFTTDPYIRSYQVHSVLCTPLLNQGKFAGMLYLENRLTPHVFTSERVTVVNLLSSQAASAIENARLYAHLEASEQKYRTLFEDTKDVIFVTSTEGHIEELNPAGLSLFGYAREELAMLHVRQLYADPAERVPLVAELEAHGVLKDYPVTFRKKDGSYVDCLMTATIRCATDGSIAGYQGIIRDITAQKQAEQERLRLATIERELAMARVFQQSLLPSTVPDWGSLEVVCYTRAAHEIGGDFYTYHDFGKSEDGTVQRFAVAVGDVSGKGMAAALLMAISLASFNTIITQTYSTDRHPIDCKHQSYTLEELLKYLSSAIGSYTKTSRQNCAFVYSEWTRCPDGSIMLRVGNAGCVAPVILREDRQVDWLDVGGLPLGVALDMPKHYVEMSLKLTEGDMVVLVSDGVIEARNIVGDMFGFERLLNAVERGPRSSGGAMLAHLLAQLRSFVQGAEQHDDVTIAVVKA